MSYQKTVGTLMAWGYQKLGTQEAMNDMYVTEDRMVHRERAKQSELSSEQSGFAELYARPTSNTRYRGGTEQMETVVRRLTPRECERLQGYPDGWCDIGDWTDSNGKVHKEADTPKYKALGNSIALPFWFWLLRRVSAEYETPATLGSLFSGIGGFDLCWTRCNGVGSVLWESELEPFCIAVSTKHFGDEDLGIEGDIREYL